MQIIENSTCAFSWRPKGFTPGNKISSSPILGRLVPLPPSRGHHKSAHCYCCPPLRNVRDPQTAGDLYPIHPLVGHSCFCPQFSSVGYPQTARAPCTLLRRPWGFSPTPKLGTRLPHGGIVASKFFSVFHRRKVEGVTAVGFLESHLLILHLVSLCKLLKIPGPLSRGVLATPFTGTPEIRPLVGHCYFCPPLRNVGGPQTVGDLYPIHPLVGHSCCCPQFSSVGYLQTVRDPCALQGCPRRFSATPKLGTRLPHGGIVASKFFSVFHRRKVEGVTTVGFLESHLLILHLGSLCKLLKIPGLLSRGVLATPFTGTPRIRPLVGHCYFCPQLPNVGGPQTV